LDRNSDGFINFKGMMVGNPFVDPYSNTIAQFQAWYSHGLLPAPVYHKWLDHCQDRDIYLSEKCKHYMMDMYVDIGSRINPYGLDYPMCNEDPRIYNSIPGSQINAPLPISSQVATLVNYTARMKPGNPPFLPDQDHYRPCAEQHLDKYLNRQDVKAAIHARLDRSHHSWKDCSDKIRYSEQDWKTSTIPLYKELLSMLSKHHIHIFVFSGDDDSICSLAGTQTWIWDLGVHPQIGETWKPWKVHNQTAGFVTKFHVWGGSFTFATVHGAGHEVPLYRPMEALQLFENYLTGEW
jgi:carboxypeptidase C (cathepsin A)